MDERGTFAAALLDASRKALAALMVERARERCQEPKARALLYSPNSIVDCEQRLHHLAEAAASGAPEVFAAHVEWSRATCAARDVPPAFLPAIVEVLGEVLQSELPADAWSVLRPHVEAGRALLAKAPADRAVPGGHDAPNAALRGVAQEFLLALLEGRREDALAAIERALDGGIPIADLHRHVVGAALIEVGRMWQAGEAHVGEERLSSAIVAETLALLRLRTVRRPAHGGRVMVASVEGNLHDLGARMVADRLERDGWTTFFLGANVPTGDLLRSAVDHHVDVLALSVGLGVHVRAAAKAVAAAHALAPKPLRVVVGGAIFNRVADLWRAVGADACAAGPEEAAAACTRLAGRK